MIPPTPTVSPTATPTRQRLHSTASDADTLANGNVDSARNADAVPNGNVKPGGYAILDAAADAATDRGTDEPACSDADSNTHTDAGANFTCTADTDARGSRDSISRSAARRGSADWHATPTPSRTATPTPSRTATPTPSAVEPFAPSPTVAAETAVPEGEPEDEESIPPVADTYDGPRPDFVRSVPVAGDLSGSTEVILTNLAFAGISLMLLLLSAEIFNQTVEENDEEIKRMARKYAGPVVGILGAVGTFWSSVFGGKGVMSALVGVLAVVGVAAFIFSFEEDGVGLNEQTLVMFVSLVAALLILTYWYDGGQILIAKNFGVASVIRLFPVGNTDRRWLRWRSPGSSGSTRA